VRGPLLQLPQLHGGFKVFITTLNYGELMKKYQYKIVDTRDVAAAGLFKGRLREDIEAYLSSLGAQGWELVNVDFRELEGGLEFAGIMKKEV
jgi:hypothetical protein